RARPARRPRGVAPDHGDPRRAPRGRLPRLRHRSEHDPRGARRMDARQDDAGPAHVAGGRGERGRLPGLRSGRPHHRERGERLGRRRPGLSAFGLIRPTRWRPGKPCAFAGRSTRGRAAEPAARREGGYMAGRSFPATLMAVAAALVLILASPAGAATTWTV